jgi:hypothetical protein
LFHFALEVESMDDLVTARDRLAAAGCLESESDHGATKAVYGHDPDNNTVELIWVLPRAEWGDWESAAPSRSPWTSGKRRSGSTRRLSPARSPGADPRPTLGWPCRNLDSLGACSGPSSLRIPNHFTECRKIWA